MQGTTPSNPYRGAMARMSEWKHQEGWSSIVTAHSEVAVQCKALYTEGGVEFKAGAPPLQPAESWPLTPISFPSPFPSPSPSPMPSPTPSPSPSPSAPP